MSDFRHATLGRTNRRTGFCGYVKKVLLGTTTRDDEGMPETRVENDVRAEVCKSEADGICSARRRACERSIVSIVMTLCSTSVLCFKMPKGDLWDESEESSGCTMDDGRQSVSRGENETRLAPSYALHTSLPSLICSPPAEFICLKKSTRLVSQRTSYIHKQRFILIIHSSLDLEWVFTA